MKNIIIFSMKELHVNVYQTLQYGTKYLYYHKLDIHIHVHEN